MMICNQKELEAVCRRFAAHPFVTVDTEFVREKSYYPRLCLIQLASPDEAVCIDPTVSDFDWAPLRALMQNESVVKVFHACRQDMEIFFIQAGVIPTPLFDTQVAAMALGFGDSVGYQAVVKAVTGVSLDKSMRYTDWQKRPLSAQQVQYALCDVTYLRDVYLCFKDKLAQTGRVAWIADEMAVLQNPKTYQTNPETVWMRFKMPLNEGLQLYLFSKLCAWREKKAQASDKPRRHIMKDEALQELAITPPTKADDFEHMRHLSQGFSKTAWAEELLDLLTRETAVFETQMKKFTYPETHHVPIKKKTLHDLMHLLVDLVCEKNKVAPKLLASSADVTDFVCDRPCRFLEGWRYELLGHLAQDLKAGKLNFTYNPAKDTVDFGELE